MSAVEREIEIAAPVERVFEVVADVASYPQFLDGLGMVGVEVLESGDDFQVVRHSVKKMGTVVTYTLRYSLQRPQRISWNFVEGQMMKDNRGSWEFTDLGDGRTRAHYQVEVRFGMLVPKSLVNAMVAKELPQMLEAFKKQAEG
ncbi:MAG: SRPBCC family protein [Deltaproteobacteria bacterium]|nr:MAG: SRPBCC family protein [Deltaproteobacteria bacterium]